MVIGPDAYRDIPNLISIIQGNVEEINDNNTNNNISLN